MASIAITSCTSLPVISIDGQPPAQTQAVASSAAIPEPVDNVAPTQEADVFSAIERLGDLLAKGILTDEEFTQKKTELLGRL